MTGFAAAATAIRTRFVEAFHDRAPDVPIAFDNVAGLYTVGGETQDEPGGEPWVRLSLRGAGAQQVALGHRRTFRHSGAVLVQIFIPAGAGEGRAQEIAEAVAAALRGVTVSGVRLAATTPPEWVGPDGAWAQWSVRTQYEFDEAA